MRRDIERYHRSIAAEFKATKDRVRDLIGGRHWLTDGEHKEAVFRKVLRNHVPESVRVGRGFVCHPDITRTGNTSTQIDVLITDTQSPTLFKDGELVIVTPDAVRAVVEVKTKLGDGTALRESLTKLADAAANIRAAAPSTRCWAGLFVFEDLADVGGLSHRHVEDDRRNMRRHELLVTSLQQSCGGDTRRAVNCVCLGKSVFTRFWEIGNDVYSPIPGAVWHSYEMTSLAQSYLVGNLVAAVSDVPHAMQFAWFPLEGGKEPRRRYYAALHGTAERFDG